MCERRLTTTAFTARLANPVTLSALELRADVNQRATANRTSRLARLLAFRSLCIFSVFG